MATYNSKKKKNTSGEKTVDELRTTAYLQTYSNLKFKETGKERTVDEIRTAMVEQGYIKPSQADYRNYSNSLVGDSLSKSNNVDEAAGRINMQKAYAQKNNRDTTAYDMAIEELTNNKDKYTNLLATYTPSSDAYKKRYEPVIIGGKDYNLNNTIPKDKQAIAQADAIVQQTLQPGSPSYDTTQKKINSLQNERAGAKRRGNDTQVYDLAIRALQNYSDSAYSLNTTDMDDASIQARREKYQRNQETIAKETDPDKKAALLAENTAYERKQKVLDDSTYEYRMKQKYGEGWELTTRSNHQQGNDNPERNGKVYGNLSAEHTLYKGADLSKINNEAEKEEARSQNIAQEAILSNLSSNQSKASFLSIPKSVYRNEIAWTFSEGSKSILTDEERAIIQDYIDNGGQEGSKKAEQFREGMQDTWGIRANEENRRQIDKLPVGEKILANIASVPFNMLGGVFAFADDAYNVLTGNEIHPYSSLQSGQLYAENVRSSTANDINKATNGANFLGFSVGDAYQAGMSIPEFAAGAAMPKWAYSIIMGSGAAASTAREMWEDGASNDQVVEMGVLAGIAEALFEEVSLEKIFSVAKGGSLLNFIKSALMGAGIEASEEVATEAANIINDCIVRGSQSDWSQYYQKYKQEGYSDSEAEAKAFVDILSRLHNAGVGGFIGGLGGGAGAAAVNGAQAISNKAADVKATRQYVNENAAKIAESGGTEKVMSTANEIIANPSTGNDTKAIQKAVTKAQKAEGTAKYDTEVARVAAEVQKYQLREYKSSGTKAVNAVIKDKITEKLPGADEAQIATMTSIAQKAYNSEDFTSELTRAEKKVYKDTSTSQIIDSVVADLRTDEGFSTVISRAIEFRDNARDQIRNTSAEFGVTEKEPSTSDLFTASDDGKDYVNGKDEPVTVQRIAAVKADGKSGDVIIKLSDGSEVSAKDMNFGDKDMPAVLGAILDIQGYGMGMTAEYANVILSAYNSSKSLQGFNVQEFVHGVREATIRGYMGLEYEGDYLDPRTAKLITTQAEKLRTDASEAQEQKNKENRGENKQEGEVTYEDNARKGTLNNNQKVSLEVIEDLSKALGIKFHIYKSTQWNGKFSHKDYGSANGFYQNGEIWIDINSGNKGEGLLLFTVSHELVHYMREGSPKSFDKLADFLLKSYAEKGYSVRDLVRSEMRKHTKLNPNEAYEEVIARLCESFLRDAHLNDRAAELYKADKTTANKVLAFLKGIKEKIKSLFTGKVESEIGKIGEKLVKEYDHALDLFVEGIRNASENLAYAKNTTGEGGVKYDIREDINGDVFVEVDSSIYDSTDGTSVAAVIAKIIKDRFNNLIETNGQQIQINKITNDEWRMSKSARYLQENNETAYNDKLHAIANADEILKAANNWVGEKLNHSRTDDIVEFARGNVKYRVGENGYVADVIVGTRKSGAAVLYDIKNIYETKITEARVTKARKNSLRTPETSVKDRISQNGKDVKEQSRDTDYLSAVKRGDMQTAQQMVDEAARAAGYTIKAYHGTPNGNFTVFKDWQYFTQNKEYADIYQNQGASSNGYKLTADNPFTYEVYLSGDNIFDTRKKACRDIFMKEFYRKWGNGAPLSEKGLPDWTDGDDLAEFFEEKGYDFDVIILDEGATGGYGDEVKSRGISYSVKDSSQVKSADPVTYDDNGDVIPLSERFNSEQKDIRYQERDTDYQNRLEELLDDELLDYENITAADLIGMFVEAHKQEIAEVEQREREESDKKVNKIIKDHERLRKSMNTKRAKSKAKKSIRHKIRDLNKLLNRSTNENTVKQELRGSASSLLKVSEMLFPDTLTVEEMATEGVEDATKTEQKALDQYAKLLNDRDTLSKKAKKLDEQIASEKSQVKKNKLKTTLDNVNAQRNKISSDLESLRSNELKDLISRTRKQNDEANRAYNGIYIKDALTELADAYKTLQEAPESYIRDAYDEELVNIIDTFKAEVKDDLAKDLKLPQLNDFNKILRMMLTTIRNANKTFTQLLKATLKENGDSIISEIKAIRMPKEKKAELLQAISKLGVNNLKPVYLIRYLGSQTLEDLYWNVQRGECITGSDIYEAKTFKEATEKKYHYKEFKFKEKRSYTAKNGRSFELNLDQRMWVYAVSRRAQGLQHLLNEGFTYEAKEGHTGTFNYSLSAETINDIINSLSANEKGYVEEMQKYLSTVMAKKGNEISMKLYGVELFNEDTYWSLTSDENYVPKNELENKGQFKLKNSGFTKAINRKATNPIVMQGLEASWSNHVYEMSLYHGMTLPLEDLNRLFNYRVHGELDSEGVKSVIQGAFSEGVKSYISTLISDLNGGVVQKSRTGVDTLISLQKKGSVLANFSVVIQQPSSLFRAMAYISPVHFVLPAGHTLINSFYAARHMREWNELKKYAPVAILKEIGSFDTGTGRGVIDYLSSGKTKSKIERFMHGADTAMSWAPQVADEIAWVQIWNACQRETKAKYGYKIGTEENKVKSGERFNEVIHLTQVYDSTLSRSGNMRSKQTFDKMVTAYMSEPLTYANMAFDMVIQAKRSGSFLKGTGTIARSTAALAMAIIANALLHAIPVAMRDDDENEKPVEKYWQAFWEDIRDGVNPFNYLPIIKDVWSIIESKINGYYGRKIERMDMSLFAKAIDTLFDFGEKIANDELSKDDIIDLIGAGVSFAGIPMNNIVRDYRSVKNTYNVFLNSDNVVAKDEIGLTVPLKYQQAYNNAYDKGYSEAECKEKAEQAARTYISKEVKPLYLEAWAAKDYDRANDLRSYMFRSGYYKDRKGTRSLTAVDKVIDGWKEGEAEEDERAKVAAERKKNK